MSVSFSGELAFELHIPNQQLLASYQILLEAGETLGLAPFGMYAVESMRLEKGYGHWKVDLISEYNPIEAGLERFVDMDKNFPGRPGLRKQLASGLKRRRVLVEIDCDSAPAQAGESVYFEDKVVGTITSAAWGYRVNKNIAMAYLLPKYCEIGRQLSVMLLGNRYQARVGGNSLYMPDGLNDQLRIDPSN